MTELSLMDQLRMPFPVNVVHWRVGATNAKKLGCKPWEATKGIGLAYIDARDVMKRLDDVCGLDWQCRYPFPGCCEIGILNRGFVSGRKDDEWIWRSNGAGTTDVEAEKGQYSDAFKRAAVMFGISRYLYYLPNKWFDLKDGKIQGVPELPSWATPEGFLKSLEKKA